jgi:glycosyltransferase involved in cell wall biosynthesis
MVLVSVIMPSYNHALYISEAIESVLEQNIRDIELIIIDDCSRDNSKEIILNYKKKDGDAGAVATKSSFPAINLAGR